ncbi:MAG: hypothetical protein MZW92_33195 [Comamonadaceae bacterium]|nr:hypothetical protein [Comamonadaceae bacterium]
MNRAAVVDQVIAGWRGRALRRAGEDHKGRVVGIARRPPARGFRCAVDRRPAERAEER